ncbi:MAG: two-component sensor histidine kinase [marine bacterium B5-7]|nr:MAG: two-component sensor histidine kinase [marine bacterium B5-7]
MFLSRPTSLRSRLLIVSTGVLLLFAATAIAVLDNTFERSARESIREQLNAQLYALLTAAELTDDGRLFFPETSPEPRFAVADSGLYAFVFDSSLRRVWQSPSAVSIDLIEAIPVAVGTTTFDIERLPGDKPVFVLRFGVAWDMGDLAPQSFTFVVVESLKRFRTSVREFRNNLYLWGAIAVGLLLLLQLASFSWALSPLARVSREIQRVESGQQRLIEENYPVEISGLTRNINMLIESSKRSLDRYRNSLGDLAHSLKTPLALLQGLSEVDSEGASRRQMLAEQTRRMSDIVEHQLKRAASSGGTASVMPVGVAVAVQRISATLGKVYADRQIRFVTDVDASIKVAMDPVDLLEVIGNLADNACKWCKDEVAISVHHIDGWTGIEVADNGPGIDESIADEVMQRGVRADLKRPGQGIGLAVVRDIVESYNGVVSIGRSTTGGARVIVKLPSA